MHLRHFLKTLGIVLPRPGAHAVASFRNTSTGACARSTAAAAQPDDAPQGSRQLPRRVELGRPAWASCRAFSRTEASTILRAARSRHFRRSRTSNGRSHAAASPLARRRNSGIASSSDAAEIAEFLAFVSDTGRHSFLHPMFCFAAHTGARRSEIAACPHRRRRSRRHYRDDP